MTWIALDFGTYRWKALRFVLEPQRISILDIHAWDSKPEYFRGLGMPESPAWAAATIALNELDWIRPEEDITITTSFPSAYLETRYLKFPFRNEKQIEKVVPFEIEAMVPFDIEELLIRHAVLDGEGLQSKRRDTSVLALAYRRDIIKKFEDEIRKFQNVVPPITSQALNFVSLRQAIPDPVFGLLEIGHQKSQLVILQKTGRILGTRTFWWGGAQLVGKLAEFLSVDYSKALSVLSKGEPPRDPLVQSISQFVADLRHTMKGMQSAGLHFHTGFPVYAFGLPTQTPLVMDHLRDGLREDLRMDLKRFPYQNLTSRFVSGLDNLENLDMALPALSVALSQLRQHRGRIPSFSESGFQFQQNLKKLRTGSFSLLRRVAVLLIAPLIYLSIQFIVQGRENERVLKELSQKLQSSGVSVELTDSTDAIVNRLKKELAANRQKIEQLNEDHQSPLAVLTEISRLIPSSLKLDVRELKITPQLVTFTAEASNDLIAGQISDILKQKYPKTKIGATSPCSTKKDCRQFTLEMERSPT